MLTPKNIAAPSGALTLAQVMAEYTTGMDVHELELRALKEAPSDWNFYRPLPDAKFLELVQSIEESGLISPLVVMERDGDYVILSGHNRRRAMLHLYEKLGDAKYLRAHCVIKRGLSDDEARGILIDANWVQRTLTPSEKARSIYHKYVQMGRVASGTYQRRYDIVAEHFGLKATQVYQYYKLAALEPFWLERLDYGALSVKAAVKLTSLSAAQRAALAAIPANNAQILATDARMAPEAIALRARGEEIPAARMLSVPAEHYEAITAMVAEYLRRHGGGTDGE